MSEGLCQLAIIASANHSLTKGRLQRGYFLAAGRVRCPRMGPYTLFPGSSGISLPALRPACEVHHWTGTGSAA